MTNGHRDFIALVCGAVGVCYGFDYVAAEDGGQSTITVVAGAPNSRRVEVPGGSLAVRMFPTEEGEHVSLSGPAELVFTGTVELQ